MLQRIQTVYLLLAFALCIVCLCLPVAHLTPADSYGMSTIDVFNLWISCEGAHIFWYCPVMMGILVIATALIFLDVWLYRQRALQMRLCSFSMILLVAWYIAYGVIIYMMLHTGNAPESWRPHWSAALPAVALVLCYLAFRGILKDEMLVRSLDRLR